MYLNWRLLYLKQLVYDKFEQRTHLEMGNGVTTDYTYNAKTRRLKTLQSQVPGAPTKLQDNLYVYDLMGNITELHDNAQVPPRNDMGGPTNQFFHYDSLYRLVSANGDYTAAHETHKYTLGMSYDAIHNITRKTQNHTVIRNGGKALEQRKTTYDWVYRYGASGNDSRQPHAPIQIGTPDDKGNPIGRSFTYDANGNQEGWTNDTNGTRRAIVWDEENRIQEVQDPQHTESYSYDDQGQRMIRRSKYGETAYINQFFTVRNGAITSTHIYAGTTRLASKVNAGTPISDTSVSSTSTTTTTVFSAASSAQGNGKGQGPTANANAQDHQNNSNGNKGGARLNGNPGQGRDRRSDTANEHAQDIYKNPTLTSELPNNNKGNNGHNGHGAGNGGGNGGSGSGNGGNTTGNGDGYGSNKTNTGSGREFLYYYHPDHLGSSTYVTDANAKRYEHIEYFPFGETWVEESSNTWRTPYLFTSKEMDPQTKLYYYGARYYDPRTSVWQSADPILGKYLPTGDKEQDANLPGMGGVLNASNLGLYTYSQQNPIKLIDPDGYAVFDSADDLMAAGKAVVADPSVQASGSTTWCNKGVGLIEERGGNTDYQGTVPGQYMKANKIVAKLQDPKYATVVSAEQAVAYAKQGATVIAGIIEKGGHGHVAIVAPKDMVSSGSWGGKVPVVFNVGSKNFIKGVNWAFSKNNQPNYYIRNADLNTLTQRNSPTQSSAKPIDFKGMLGDFPKLSDDLS